MVISLVLVVVNMMVMMVCGNQSHGVGGKYAGVAGVRYSVLCCWWQI